MCGRFGLFIDLDELVDMLSLDARSISETYRPSWNITPSTDVVAITQSSGGRQASMMRWGLIPHWAKGPTSFPRPMINARSETIAEKPMFSGAFRERRCIVPANGFYEWRSRKPIWFYDAESPVMLLAGIWNVWEGADHGIASIASLAIVTTDANEQVRPTHDRMPVALDASGAEIWLEDSVAEDLLHRVMVSRPWETVVSIEANPAVSAAKNDGPHLLEGQTGLV